MPLASTVPSAPTATANGLPGHVGQRPRAGVLVPRRSGAPSTRGSRSNASTAGASARQMWQPSEVKTASPKSCSPSPAKCSASAVRPPISGPSPAISSAPCGAIASRSSPTSRASASSADREHRDAGQRRAEADRQPLLGAQRAPLEQRQHRGRGRQQGGAADRGAADPAPGAEAPARRAAAAPHQRGGLRGGEDGEQRRRRPRGALGAGREPDRQAGLDRAERRPGDARQRLAANAVGGQRRAPGGARGQLHPGRDEQQEGEGERQRDGQHGAREPSA